MEHELCKRVFIHKNESSSQGISLEIGSDVTLQSLKKIGFEKLGLKKPVKSIFLGSGLEVQSMEEILPKDNIYFSVGEPYFRLVEGMGEKVNVSVLGGGGVGKSAITLRYIRDHFIQNWEPTIEDAYRKTMKVDNALSVLEVLDTAGQDDFSMLRSQWMQDKDGFVFVYSLLDRESIAQLYNFVNLLEQVCVNYPVPPIVFVGNKSDLVHDDEGTDDGRAQTRSTEGVSRSSISRPSAASMGSSGGCVKDDVTRIMEVCEQTSERIYLSWASKNKGMNDRYTKLLKSSPTPTKLHGVVSHTETSACTGDGIDEVFERLVRDIRRRRMLLQDISGDGPPRRKSKWCFLL